jgi:ketosteroid isomerase-like protein
MAEVDWEQRLRKAIAEFNAGNFEAVLEAATEDIEYQRGANAPDAHEVIRGKETLTEFFRPDVLEDQRFEILDLEVGADSAVARMVFSARGAASGLAMDTESWVVYRIADGLVNRIEVYETSDEAYASAGLDA